MHLFTQLTLKVLWFKDIINNKNVVKCLKVKEVHLIG